MKITYILPHSGQSVGYNDEDLISAEIYWNIYCRLMLDLGHEVELILLGKGGKIKEFKHPFGHKIIQMPISFGNRYGRDFSLKLFDYLRQIDADIIHINAGPLKDNVIPMLHILSKTEIPVIVNHLGHSGNYSKYKIGHIVFKHIFKKLFKKVDMLISGFKGEVEELKRVGVSSDKLRYVPLGADLSMFFPQSKEEAREKLKLSREKRYLLFVGRLVKLKGVEYLLKSVNILKEKYSDINLLIVGCGFEDEEQRLKRMSRELNIEDIVDFVGGVFERERLALYYNAADICVFPAQGFSLVVAEALACKRPIVVTKREPEGLKHGEHAVLAEIKSPESLVENISMLLDNEELRDKISSNGYDHIINNYDWKKIGERLNDVYTEVISRRKNGRKK